MKHIFRQVFHSGKFITGFCIFASILLIVIIYPLLVTDHPLRQIGQGTFFPPGVYVNVYDSINTSSHYDLRFDDSEIRRIADRLEKDDIISMKKWLMASGIREKDINTEDLPGLINQWKKNYEAKKNVPGMTNAERNHYSRLDKSLAGILSNKGLVISEEGQDSSDLVSKRNL